MSAFLLSFCTWHMRADNTQRGSRNLEDEALTKRSKSDDTIELKVLLRCATESSDAGVSRLKLAITRARSERTCAPARGLESSGRTLPHCPLRACEIMSRPARSQTAARSRLDMAGEAFDVVSVGT